MTRRIYEETPNYFSEKMGFDERLAVMKKREQLPDSVVRIAAYFHKNHPRVPEKFVVDAAWSVNNVVEERNKTSAYKDAEKYLSTVETYMSLVRVNSMMVGELTYLEEMKRAVRGVESGAFSRKFL